MHKIPLVFFLSAFICLGFSGAVAQSRNLTKNEYEKMSRAAFDKTRRFIRRETSEEVSWEDGKIIEKIVTTQDYIPPNKEMWIIDGEFEGEKEKTEIIIIGSNEYRRVNSGNWEKKDSGGTEPLIMQMDQESEAVRTEKISYLISKPTGEKGVEQVLEYRSNFALSFYPGWHVQKIFLDKLGRIVRIEESAAREPNVKELIHKALTTFQYEPTDIKIEAPIK